MNSSLDIIRHAWRRLRSSVAPGALSALIAVTALGPALAAEDAWVPFGDAPPAKQRAQRPPAKPAALAPPRTPIVPATGCGSPGALGVSRTVEIDTSVGHRYGHQQSDVEDFLQEGEVVLTFDDGPLRSHTAPILKALDNHCTKAIFFSVGRMALSDPAMVQEVMRRGHTLGTHTWSHKDLMKIGTSRAKDEFELGFSAVTKAAGQPIAPFFRFPYLSAPKGISAHAHDRNISVFSIDVDSEDYRTKDPELLHRRIVGRLVANGKGILLFHDIQPSTARALQGILDDIKARGFKVVQVKAKGTATTLPEFDAIAAKQMSGKVAAAEQDPLASRSFVWTASSGKGGRPAGAGGPKPAGDGPEVLPWGTAAVKPEPILPDPRRKPAPKPAESEDGDWFAKLFKPN